MSGVGPSSRATISTPWIKQELLRPAEEEADCQRAAEQNALFNMRQSGEFAVDGGDVVAKFRPDVFPVRVP